MQHRNMKQLRTMIAFPVLWATLAGLGITVAAIALGAALPAAAQDAEMSLDEYRDFVFRAGMLHRKDPVAEWKKVSKQQARLAKKLGRLKTIRIAGKDTDLTFKVTGRKWINCDGHENFPDGELFTGPVEDSAEGHISSMHQPPCLSRHNAQASAVNRSKNASTR